MKWKSPADMKDNTMRTLMLEDKNEEKTFDLFWNHSLIVKIQTLKEGMWEKQ